ncbi:MAG: hypothetical protein AOA65_1369 [Candidatus Bathyarchaeota archaeon BA1]|nr:MAG: hypothetical protein AOA65_1369 [Candidatus Bathyarchaeota archaeon BA1]
MSNKTYSIQFELVKHLITFPAYVNGKGPFDFWLDTGGPGLMLRRFLAEELGLEVIDTGRKGVGAGGEVPILVTTVKSFQFGELELENVQVHVLELTGMEEKFGHKFYGCIGYEVLKEFKVCIDYPKRELMLTK